MIADQGTRDAYAPEKKRKSQERKEKVKAKGDSLEEQMLSFPKLTSFLREALLFKVKANGGYVRCFGNRAEGGAITGTICDSN